MKAILMAAGRGSRISRHIGDDPKCTLDVGGIELIKHTVSMLTKNNIEVILVLGYQGHVIQEVLADFDVKYYINPFYNVTNSIASLWFAREEFNGEDIILSNADVYWDEDLLEVMLAEEQTPVMLADSSRGEEGDYLFKWSDNKLEKFGKDLSGPDITGEYVGIALLRQKDQASFLNRMEEMIHNQEHGVWWENVLYSGIPEKDVYVKDINPLFWAEVDYIEDYYRILQYRKNKGLSDIDLDEIRQSFIQNK